MAANQPTLFDTEIWKPVPGTDGYEVSTLGRVRSIERYVERSNGVPQLIKGRILKPWKAHDGYLYVRFGRRTKKKAIHRVVLETFVGTPRENDEGRHLDGNRQNNSLLNLRWGTRSENTFDQVRIGTHNNARKTHCPQGHAYTPENTNIKSTGGRQCRTCNKARSRAFYLKNIRERN